MRVLIAGDYCDNGRTTALIENGDSTTLFGSIQKVLFQYDYRIVNFEFPVVVSVSNPIPKCGPSLKGSKKAIDVIKNAGFNVCTMANNHVLDQGANCLLETKQLLEHSDVKVVGAGANLQEASETLYLEKDGERTAIINCCEHEFSIAGATTPGTNPLNPVTQYKSIKEAREKADYVVVIIHGGVEHFQYPTKRMKELYRFFIDTGADAVINHHQHCFCGYEVYNGRPIFYGIGNLLFDIEGKRNSIWNKGALVGLTLTKKNEPKFEVYPFEQSNERVGVSLLSIEEQALFLEKCNIINSIIIDDEKLEAEYSKLVASKRMEYELLVEPYDGRLMKGLYNRGVLPSMLSKGKLAKFYNYINCESHHEVFLSVLGDLFRK